MASNQYVSGVCRFGAMGSCEGELNSVTGGVALVPFGPGGSSAPAQHEERGDGDDGRDGERHGDALDRRVGHPAERDAEPQPGEGAPARGERRGGEGTQYAHAFASGTPKWVQAILDERGIDFAAFKSIPMYRIHPTG